MTPEPLPDPNTRPAGVRWIDLHSHTTASDGSLSPVDLVALAADQGLSALGITDHDTLAAIPAAQEAARAHAVELVPGIELSLKFATRFHLLGYLIRTDDSQLCARLSHLQEMRATRNERMARRMEEVGLGVTMEDIRAESGGDLIARPHMALALLKKGLVRSVQEAFDRYLADGALCSVPKETVSVREGLELVRAAGGVPVVAHPTTLRLDNAELEVALRQWKDWGLGGLECYYSQHTPEEETAFADLANRLDLVATGGSDFHGASKPHVQLGVIRQGRAIPYTVLERLRTAR